MFFLDDRRDRGYRDRRNMRDSRGESRDDRRKRIMRRAKGDVSFAYKAAASDHSIIQAINAYNEIDKVKNTIYERLEEWYGAYFPNVRLNDHEVYRAKLISKVGSKEVEESVVAEIVGENSAHVFNAIKESRGFPEMDAEEYKALSGLAEQELTAVEMQKGLDAFLEMQTKKFIPNIVYLIDYKIAAELLSKAGLARKACHHACEHNTAAGSGEGALQAHKVRAKPPKYGRSLQALGAQHAGKEAEEKNGAEATQPR